MTANTPSENSDKPTLIDFGESIEDGELKSLINDYLLKINDIPKNWIDLVEENFLEYLDGGDENTFKKSLKIAVRKIKEDNSKSEEISPKVRELQADIARVIGGRSYHSNSIVVGNGNITVQGSTGNISINPLKEKLFSSEGKIKFNGKTIDLSQKIAGTLLGKENFDGLGDVFIYKNDLDIIISFVVDGQESRILFEKSTMAGYLFGNQVISNSANVTKKINLGEFKLMIATDEEDIYFKCNDKQIAINKDTGSIN